ncbi:MAG: WXG100 family type VII secretion target [Bifidobacteriaceae bacterium]|jgi:WXG100 family type VII secretion target|nr:WXG100 family type VII secretion target [Bifidobacteriaceae bacterium]
MYGFTVNPDAIVTASAQVRASIGAIGADVATMNAHLLQLQSSWTGQAAQAFTATMEQWRGAQRSVETALESINTALTAAGQSYADTEAGNQAMFVPR